MAIQWMIGLALAAVWLVCTEPTAKRALAPGWHWPQVRARFALWTGEVGSWELRISWAPWQLEQLTASVEPPRVAKPW
ncbi:MAG: hypothetical protein IPL39_24220 [Opitutaceae bacterium]|nr:hypothetical protein [Opitutaceae bacterium]